MSADDPKTMGDCWEIFNRNGIAPPESPLAPNLFENARHILEMEKRDVSKCSTKDLVSELRKRDGVEEFDISIGGYSEIQCAKLQIKPFVNFGKATILRITNLTEVKK